MYGSHNADSGPKRYDGGAESWMNRYDNQYEESAAILVFLILIRQYIEYGDTLWEITVVG